LFAFLARSRTRNAGAFRLDTAGRRPRKRSGDLGFQRYDTTADRGSAFYWLLRAGGGIGLSLHAPRGSLFSADV
jgi:hypothetical protein